MNYEEMSDFEINKAVAEIVYKKIDRFKHVRTNSLKEQVFYIDSELDYCNNPNDAWPVILRSGISLINHSGTTAWLACSDSGFSTVCMSPDGSDNGVSVFHCDNDTHSTNPLRAAMIVFLMMNEEVEK